jgi:hypothetical protein
MNLPAKKDFEIPASLNLLLRPSAKYPEVIVGEVFFSCPSLGMGIGLQVRLNKAAVMGAESPLDVAAKEGCHAIQHYLHDASVVFHERLHAQQAAPVEPPHVPPSPPVTAFKADSALIQENQSLKNELVALQAKYDQREAAGWGISGV